MFRNSAEARVLDPQSRQRTKDIGTPPPAPTKAGLSPLMYVGFLIALLAYFAFAVIFDRYDRKHNYTVVTANILSVERLCYLTKPKSGFFEKGKISTAEGQCAKINQIKDTSPEFRDADVVGKAVIEVTYISPVDHVARKGTMIFRDYEREYTTLRVNDNLPILTHKTDVEKFLKM